MRDGETASKEGGMKGWNRNGVRGAIRRFFLALPRLLASSFPLRSFPPPLRLPVFPSLRLSVLLPFLLSVSLLTGCSQLRVADPSPVQVGDWVTEGESPLRTFAVEADVAPPLEEAWDYNAEAGFGPGSALLLGEVALVATRKGEVHAIDLLTGKKHNMSGFGDAIEGMPVVDDGVLYVPIAWGRRALVAYDLRSGTTVWSHRHPPIEAGLLALPDAIVGVDFEGNVRAYDKSDGAVRWTHALGEDRLVRAAPVHVGGTVIVADDGGRVTALTEQGAEVWTRALGAPVLSTPASDGRLLFVPTTRGIFVALDVQTGNEVWRYVDEREELYLTSPALADGTVIVAGSDGDVRAFEAHTGQRVWTHAAQEAVRAPPLVAGDYVYVATMAPELRALDLRTGEERWSTEIGGRVKSAMAARAGMLVVLSEEKRVYLFKPEEVSYATTD